MWSSNPLVNAAIAAGYFAVSIIVVTCLLYLWTKLAAYAWQRGKSIYFKEKENENAKRKGGTRRTP
jgi:hypothetical protein